MVLDIMRNAYMYIYIQICIIYIYTHHDILPKKILNHCIVSLLPFNGDADATGNI